MIMKQTKKNTNQNNTNTNTNSNNKYKLEILFNNVLQKSYQLRKENPKTFDGKTFWQPIKKRLETLDNHSASKWKTLSKSKTKKIMLLPEYTINGYETKQINEKNHFMIQQVRIPLQDKPTIKKIIQIALNIGQYKGTNKSKNISKTKTKTKNSNKTKNNNSIKYNNINQFIYKNDIIKLSNYITNDIIDEINKYLSF